MLKAFFVDISHVLLIAGVVVVMLFLRKALWLLRLPPHLRLRRNHLLPVIEALGAFTFLLWVVWLLAPDNQESTWIAAAIVGIIVLAAGWFAIRDVVSGVIIRAENAYAEGQWVQINEIRGAISKIGYRALMIETESGLQVKLPYSQLSKSMLTTSRDAHASKAHSFLLETSSAQTIADAMAKIRTTALSAFWSSPLREPQVHFLKTERDLHQFEVTVFAMNEAYAIAIEQSVRRHL